jgi:hypothetical protein
MKRATCLLAIILGCSRVFAADDALRVGFTNPPITAHPQTWWHWMNGNVTREGITADLEAMHRVGIQEANIITVASDIPPGPVQVMSPQFFEMVEFAAKEADRLGMTLCMDNCPGWSSSGGPWVTPEHAMQTVVTSEATVAGPVKFSQLLPQPPTKLGYYRDIAVLAFKTPAGEDSPSLATLSAMVSSSAADFDGAKLIDGDAKSFASLPSPETKQPQFILIEFPKPQAARAMILTAGPKCPACHGVIDLSDDGQHFHGAIPFSIARGTHTPVNVSLGTDTITAKYFKLTFTERTRELAPITLAEIGLTSRAVIGDLARKAIVSADEIQPLAVEKAETSSVPADQAVQRSSIVDLNSMLKPDGSLSWDAPQGSWTILRIGYTPTGVTNHPAPPEATGLECDKLSKAGLDASWNGMMQPLIDKLGPLSGKVLVDCLIDSYETGGQNWTPGMIEEFKKHRGYDPTPYLPTLTGRVVDSEEVSERFLWDWRRTISDLFAENYFDYFAELCHKHGLKSLVEPYTGPFESLACGRAADVPMGEFWAGGNSEASVKLASSVGHIYGRNVIGAESFTGGPEHGRWTDDPYSLKALGDLAFSQGINRYIFHRFAHQPWMNRYPGMTMGQWGINLDRTNTWFELAKPWLDYVSRSQFLLQQGKFVADAAYFCGESAPVVTRVGNPPLPNGFDYDSINADVLLKASVQNGRLTLPDGMSYAVLVLPPTDPAITPELLKKLRDLVADGLTVVGEKPKHSPSLRNYPQCDQDVIKLADEMWADCDGAKVTEHALGKGKVVWGKPLADVFAELKIAADFSTDKGQARRSQFLYIHRAIADGAAKAEIYFVANHLNTYASARCTFRVSGMVPELWHPDTGTIELAPVYEQTDGVTTLPLNFDPVGSVFVVFRQRGDAPHVAAVSRTAGQNQPAAPEQLKIRRASYEAVDGSGGQDVTATVADLVADGMLNVDVNNSGLGGDPAPGHVKRLVVDAIVEGQPRTITIDENQPLLLGANAATGNQPAYEMRRADDGSVELLSFRPGSYQLKTDAGQVLKLDDSTGATLSPIDGPWELQFPPNWGAPPKVQLDKLISWPDHPDAGVKYFSGTATYLKRIDIPATTLGDNRSVYLDLGTVKNFAQVSLNGKDLGILWKPPFRVDITSAAKPGANDLQIKVTNLWPNRIIGDAQLPDDVEWQGMKPANWPQWLLDGKPSPTGRLTFTTWRHWTKTGKLLDSGLLGPVNIESGQWQRPK